MKAPTLDKSAPFPIDWTEWHALWIAWLAEQRERGNVSPSSWRFPEKNFLADEVLGVWSINGRPTELSEVTFPDLSPGGHGKRARYVGVTFGQGSGTENGGIASTFDELELALGIADDEGAICRHCGDPIGTRDRDGVWVDENGLTSCTPLAERHEP